jgi:hypothetical protein
VRILSALKHAGRFTGARREEHASLIRFYDARPSNFNTPYNEKSLVG